MKKVLVTGSAGFIGSEVSLKLLKQGHAVIGIDNHNDYYEPALKEARLARHARHPAYTHLRLDLKERKAVADVFEKYQPQRVVHLAAQAGVRYSLVNPHAYIDANLVGFGNILEGCRQHAAEHLVYASSSSVYGANTKMPFSVSDNVDHPVSLYAATKKANELMAHAYSHLYAIPVTGLRFFTVYGPWGRPDMAYFSFTRKILAGEPIDVYNYGNSKRDFTYIDDIVEGVFRILERIPEPAARTDGDSAAGSSSAPYRIYNIGNNNPVMLDRFLAVLENCLGRKAKKNFLPLQPGDVPATYADIDDLKRDIAYEPKTRIENGLENFVKWYKTRY
ncbi:MAG: NAD-dependent epimerase [Gammaproteobacteria bacterium]|nr:NAD-dependent epimerase [Gammaproteobacteria bacterium]